MLYPRKSSGSNWKLPSLYQIEVKKKKNKRNKKNEKEKKRGKERLLERTNRGSNYKMIYMVFQSKREERIQYRFSKSCCWFIGRAPCFLCRNKCFRASNLSTDTHRLGVFQRILNFGVAETVEIEIFIFRHFCSGIDWNVKRATERFWSNSDFENWSVVFCEKLWNS